MEEGEEDGEDEEEGVGGEGGGETYPGELTEPRIFECCYMTVHCPTQME